MLKKICLWIRKFKMNKFYRGELFGFRYKATGVGWHKVPLLRNFPYLTGTPIRIRLSLTPLYDNEEWQQGVLRCDPPYLSSKASKDEILRTEAEYGEGFLFEEWQRRGIQENTLEYKFQMGKWWSRVIPVQNGENFLYPRSFQCYLRLENHYNEISKHSLQTGEIRIADIEIMSETRFWAWVIPIIVTTAIALITWLRLVN